jgi:hypothetical protein
MGRRLAAGVAVVTMGVAAACSGEGEPRGDETPTDRLAEVEAELQNGESVLTFVDKVIVPDGEAQPGSEAVFWPVLVSARTGELAVASCTGEGFHLETVDTEDDASELTMSGVPNPREGFEPLETAKPYGPSVAVTVRLAPKECALWVLYGSADLPSRVAYSGTLDANGQVPLP